MLTSPTLQTLTELGLRAMARAYREQMENAELQSLSFDERLGLMVDREWSERQSRRLARRLAEAHLRLPAALEAIDFEVVRSLDKALVHRLAEGRWLAEHRNVLITGPTGVGKTFVACALGNAACRQGFRVHYLRLARLLTELELARADGTLPKFLARLAHTDLLVIDDWGLSPIEPHQARGLLEVIDDRTETRSTLIASQIPMDSWHATILDPTVADAILDRLVHNAYRLDMQGGSMRKVRQPG